VDGDLCMGGGNKIFVKPYENMGAHEGNSLVEVVRQVG
jgi:hypothetical protein